MISSFKRLYENKELYFMVQLWLWIISINFSFGSTEGASRAGLIVYLLSPSVWIKLSALITPIVTLLYSYWKGEISAHIGRLFVGRNFFFLWYLIYLVILIPASAIPKFSFIRLVVMSINLFVVSSLIIQAQQYFGDKAMAYISLGIIKFTGLLTFIPLYSLISQPEKLTNLMKYKRYVIGGGIMHPVTHTVLLLTVICSLVYFPKNIGGDLQRQFKKWRNYAIFIVVLQMSIALSRGPMLGMAIAGGCNFLYIYLNRAGVSLPIIILGLIGFLGALSIVSLISCEAIDLQNILKGMSRGESSDGSISMNDLTTGRADVWIHTFHSITPFSLFFGHGFGNMFPIIEGLGDGGKEFLVHGAHNSFIMTFAQSGLIGLTLLTLYFFQCILLIVKSRKVVAPQQSGFYIMVFVFISIDSLTNSTVGATMTMNLAYYLIVFSMPLTLKSSVIQKKTLKQLQIRKRKRKRRRHRSKDSINT